MESARRRVVTPPPPLVTAVNVLPPLAIANRVVAVDLVEPPYDDDTAAVPRNVTAP